MENPLSFFSCIFFWRRLLITFLIVVRTFLYTTPTWANHSEKYQKLFEEIKSLDFEVYSLNQRKTETIENKYENLYQISEKVKKLATNFHQEVIEGLKKNKPLHGEQLTLLHKLVSVYMALDYNLLVIARKASKQTYKILPLLDRVLNLKVIYLPYYKEASFRRLVNAEDLSYRVERNQLRKTIRALIKGKEQRRLKAKYYSFVYNVNQRRIHPSEPKVQSILEHPIKETLLNDRYWKNLRKKLFFGRLSDFGARLGTEVVHHSSGVFGNTMGSIRWRRGYLDKNKKVEQEIFHNLRPLDVITEKVGYTPTDFFIPGHFGHNAIWLGTKEQLIELGLWEHPIFVPYQKKIEEGLSLIETDRSGTHLKSLTAFMNVDEFGILRFSQNIIDIENDKKKVLEVYKTAFAQLGKTYDFNFDVETTDQLVCSELLYQSFGFINWPTEAYVGRTTITPDNVVSLALYDNPPMSLILYLKANKKRQVVKKGIDSLAKDLGFRKKGNLYKKPVKNCERVWLKRPGTRGKEKISRLRCETVLTDLVYYPPAPIDDI